MIIKLQDKVIKKCYACIIFFKDFLIKIYKRGSSQYL